MSIYFGSTGLWRKRHGFTTYKGYGARRWVRAGTYLRAKKAARLKGF